MAADGTDRHGAAAAGPFAAVAAHAVAGYPNEVCGLLVRPRPGGGLRAVACRNRAARPDAAFSLDTVELVRILSELDRGGGAVAGVYHSHPDGPARMSARDRELAAADEGPWLPGAAQLVVAVTAGVVTAASLSVWDAGEERFVVVSERRVSELCRASSPS